MHDLPTSPADLLPLLRQLTARLGTLADEAEKAAEEVREVIQLLERIGPIDEAGRGVIDDALMASYGSGATTWAAAQDFLRTMRGGLDEHADPDESPATVRTEPPAANPLTPDELTLLTEGPELPEPIGGTHYLDPNAPTPTAQLVLDMLKARPQGVYLDELTSAMEAHLGRKIAPTLPRVFEAALRTEVGKGVRAIVGNKWTLYVHQDAPEPIADRLARPRPYIELPQPDGPRPIERQNLTSGEWDELGRLAKEPQATYGKGRTRIQTRLVRFGFAHRHDTADGERCEITDAGCARLEQGR